MQIIENFNEYEILAMADGKKIESWNGVVLNRPDPQIVWPAILETNYSVDAIYDRSKTGGGSWNIINKKIPSTWQIHYDDMTFNLKLMGFKHTGLFPEQAYNWKIIKDVIGKGNHPVKVLNLFAYTGAATVAAASVGAEVTHVDSSKGMVDWAKENAKSSNLEAAPIRYLVDDCKKFVKREIRRGNKYDIILMDPPSFGRGSNGEVWDIESDLYELVSDCTQLLTNKPLLFIINCYTTGLSMSVLNNILQLTINQKYPGTIFSDELGLPMKDSNLVLPCGITARWESK